MTAERSRMLEFLRRLDASEFRDSLVLRGGLLMDHWIPARRVVKDLDFLGLGSLDEADIAVRSVCSAGDALRDATSTFVIVDVEKTWEETASLGLRYETGPEPLQLDVAVGDPLVAPPSRIMVDGVNVLAVCPEIMYGWKAHGLFERGEGKWRARDLWDLYLIQTHLPLDDELLRKAVEVAFSSRDTTFDVTERFFADEWGHSYGSKRKWTKFSRESADAAVLDDLHEVKQAVASKLKKLLLS